MLLCFNLLPRRVQMSFNYLVGHTYCTSLTAALSDLIFHNFIAPKTVQT